MNRAIKILLVVLLLGLVRFKFLVHHLWATDAQDAPQISSQQTRITHHGLLFRISLHKTPRRSLPSGSSEATLLSQQSDTNPDSLVYEVLTLPDGPHLGDCRAGRASPATVCSKKLRAGTPCLWHEEVTEYFQLTGDQLKMTYLNRMAARPCSSKQVPKVRLSELPDPMCTKRTSMLQLGCSTPLDQMGFCMRISAPSL